MAVGGGVPPPEAARGAKGISVVITVVIAVVTFVAGLGLGYFIAPTPATGPPRLLLGTNTPFPPFEYYNNTTSGRVLVGFDIELIQTLVTRSGYSYERRGYTDLAPLLPPVRADGGGLIHGANHLSSQTGKGREDSNHSIPPHHPFHQ